MIYARMNTHRLKTPKHWEQATVEPILPITEGAQFPSLVIAVLHNLFSVSTSFFRFFKLGVFGVFATAQEV